MPELPDVTIYIERLDALLTGHVLEKVRVRSAFLVRSVLAPEIAEGRVVRGFHRLGKRVVWCFDGDLHFVIHLMIAGRLNWRARGAGLPGKRGLAAFDFAHGSVIFTEAATRKRASLHVVEGRAALAEHDPGGLEVTDTALPEFAAAVRRENHTLKRTLTDPRLLSGIGNAYSDEILHRARLSPLKLSQSLGPEEMERLWSATRGVLAEWTDRLRGQSGDGLPEKVTAFREGMAVHGRYREPCPVCGSPVQRIAYADNETNYCATCQTGGRLLADRGLSRLLRKDWPRTLEELEALRNPR
jgi:formamidopyrimidine-DNA glycosylase